MRITETERHTLVSVIKSVDPDAEVYLFGSRARDDLKGGDIDLFVLSEVIDFSKKLDILVAIKRVLGERKIDLRIFRRADAGEDPFYQAVRPGAIRLDE